MVLIGILGFISMNILEIDETINDIQKALGFKVQSVFFYDKTLVLKLWQNHKGYLLVLSARWGQQGIVLIDDRARLKLKSEKKPLTLFANTHFKDASFIDISKNLSLGRFVELTFSSPPNQDSRGGSKENETLSIELCLIPSALNLSLQSGPKKIHLNKPKELPLMAEMDLSKLKVRSLDELKRPWIQELSGKVKSASQNETNVNKTSPNQAECQSESRPFAPSASISARERALQKKRKVLVKVNEDLKDKMTNEYLEFANLLMVDVKEAKEKFPELYDEKKNKHKLKDFYFEKHKSLMAKRERVQNRLFELQTEIHDLEQMTDEAWDALQSQKSQYRITTDVSAKTRKLLLAPDLVAYFGKSAADNLKLLRSAKAWHQWFHIKDLPSSHMIIFKDKTRVLTGDEIKKACQWFWSENKERGQDASSEVPVEFLMTECRYVKPIKGDKLGRVTYSHEQVFRLRL